MEIKLIDKSGKPTKSSVQLSEVTFGREFNEALVHQVVVAYQANARTATRAQLGRGNVSHTTHKPWNQKGTGRARSGMSSSPIWRGGGRAFPNSPDENFSHKVNRKAYRAGMCTILSELIRQARLSVIEEFSVDTPKTKNLVEKIKGLGFADGVLLLVDGFDENLYLSARNVPKVLVVETKYVDPLSLVRFPIVVVTSSVVKKLKEMLA